MNILGKFLRSPISRVLIALCFALSVWTCGDDNPVTPPDDTPQPLKYKDESELLAVYTAGTLRPQEWLAKQIDHELDLIRTTWGDSLPDVKMQFRTPWAGGITVRVSQQLLDEIKADSNAEWKALVTELNLNVHFYNFSFNPRYLSLRPLSNMHPVRIAEYFVALPGVEYLFVGDILQDWDDYFTRVPTPGGAKYYFKHNTCPDLWNAYTYIEITGDSAVLVGVHHECFEAMVSGPPWLEYERFEQIIDSLEVNRAVWVDPVRQAISKFDSFPGFMWALN